MHIGAAGAARGERGAAVARGDVIADVDEDKLGCPVHASVTGKIKSVSPTQIEITTSK